MENEKRLYVTRFYPWGVMADSTQGVIGGIMMAVCFPDKGGIPTHLTTTREHCRSEWLYKCECTAEQYERFTEVISGYFNLDRVTFDYKKNEE